MNEAKGQITLGPEEEAERLWQGAVKAYRQGEGDLVALCEALDLGIHAVETMVIQRLQPVKERFPATIVIQLETPDPAVDVYRDAITAPRALQFTDILDLLSAEGLECVGPRMHRGWEDRRFACARSRRTAQEAVGFALTGQERESLLLLAAYRNRIFRYPPPIRIVPGEIRDAFPVLVALAERLQLSSEI